MKKKLMLTALIASAILSSCTKSDGGGSGTPTPTPSKAATLDSTEKLLLGKWIVEKHIDSSITVESGVPGTPFVFNLSTDGRYLELKSTRDNFLVGSDLKNKDCTDALYNVAAGQYWWYDASKKLLYLNPDDYELLYLSSNKLVIRTVLSDNTSGTQRRYRSITSHMNRE
jgi:hypothetical protein